MPITKDLSRQNLHALTVRGDSDRWMRDGRRMARREHHAVFESIDLKHGAESSAHQALSDRLKARGRAVLDARTELDRTLTASGFNQGEHLQHLANGRVDLVWALGLMLLNAMLALFVLLGFGPWFLTVPLALLVLVTALPVEEFFQAYDEKASLREALFLILAVLALGAQFWLGTIRGLFLTALTPIDAGPVTHALQVAAPALRWGLGILTVVSECLCGYKLQRARAQLLSASARAVRSRDRCTGEIVTLHGAIKTAEAEPDVRRAYRQIGARQYLGEQAHAAATAERKHFTRAAAWALAILVALAGLFLFASDLFAEPAPARRVIVLLDLTKSVTPNSFQSNVQGVGQVLGRLGAGDQVIVLGITDGFGRPRILIARTLPTAGYLGFELQAGREVLSAEWRKLAGALQPTYQHTDVLGTLALVPFVGNGTPPTHLIVFSDLRQSSPLLNVETMPRIDVQTAMARISRAQAVPILSGTRVFLLGVDPTGVTAEYYASLRAFWVHLFQTAGADVKQFSVGHELIAF